MKKLVFTAVIASVLAGCDSGPSEQERAMQYEMQERKREREEHEAKEKQAKDEAERKEAARIQKRREQALKIISHELAADKEIVKQYQNEVLAIEENKADFIKRLNDIQAPDSETVTNTVTIHAGVEKKKTVVKKVELSENQKSVWKLRVMFEDGVTRSLYDRYTDRSAKKIVDELDREWNIAEGDYLNVTKALMKIDAEEAKARQALTAEFQSERDARISKSGRRINALKKQREEVLKKIRRHESGKCLMSQLAGPRSHGAFGGNERATCKCEIHAWKDSLQSINDEINNIQSKKNAEQSTSVGLRESSRLDEVSNEASRKRAEINQEYTHQSAVLKGIADKYEKLLVQDLLDFMATRREYLIRQIDEIVARNELKIKYIDGRSELSPEMATSFIDSDNQKTMSGLHLVNKEEEEKRLEKENERLINTIKALNTDTLNLNVNETSERSPRRRRRRTNSDGN